MVRDKHKQEWGTERKFKPCPWAGPLSLSKNVLRSGKQSRQPLHVTKPSTLLFVCQCRSWSLTLSFWGHFLNTVSHGFKLVQSVGRPQTAGPSQKAWCPSLWQLSLRGDAYTPSQSNLRSCSSSSLPIISQQCLQPSTLPCFCGVSTLLCTEGCGHLIFNSLFLLLPAFLKWAFLHITKVCKSHPAKVLKASLVPYPSHPCFTPFLSHYRLPLCFQTCCLSVHLRDGSSVCCLAEILENMAEAFVFACFVLWS